MSTRMRTNLKESNRIATTPVARSGVGSRMRFHRSVIQRTCHAKPLVAIIVFPLVLQSCSGPVPLTDAIEPEHDSAYLEYLNAEHMDGRAAYLTWKRAESGKPIDELEHQDAALSSTRNPFDAYADADAVSRGAVLFKYHCARCHGDACRGNGPSVLPDHPANDFHAFGQRFAATLHRGAPRRWFKSITEGTGDIVSYPDEQPGPAMPAFGTKLTREQVWLLITYLQSLDARFPGTGNAAASE
ncbi:MAG: c-type cytochrome [Phycisphaerales bacterium]|nr:c-type cytochrome [Phycisphaerales bacterium]MCB9858579.1 c-type cytochrome [Phycisphaerales bacterium]